MTKRYIRPFRTNGSDALLVPVHADWMVSDRFGRYHDLFDGWHVSIPKLLLRKRISSADAAAVKKGTRFALHLVKVTEMFDAQ